MVGPHDTTVLEGFTRSESQFQICVEDRASASQSKRNGRIADCRSMQVQKLVVPADNSVLEREEAYAASKVPWIAILPINCRTAEVELESLRHEHCRPLELETMREDNR